MKFRFLDFSDIFDGLLAMVEQPTLFLVAVTIMLEKYFYLNRTNISVINMLDKYFYQPQSDKYFFSVMIFLDKNSFITITVDKYF